MKSIDNIPHILKYMGSKREIIDFVTQSIDQLNVKNGWFCDLFSGTAVVGATLKGKYNIHSNDIQSYSGVLAKTYFSDLKTYISPETILLIHKEALQLVKEFKSKYPEFLFDAMIYNTHQRRFINDSNLRRKN